MDKIQRLPIRRKHPAGYLLGILWATRNFVRVIVSSPEMIRIIGGSKAVQFHYARFYQQKYYQGIAQERKQPIPSLQLPPPI